MGKKVLIVDDSKVMRMVIKKGLTQAGFEFQATEATNGKEGLDAFNANVPELILSDWQMPEMNGLEFVKEVRKENATIPIFMVTTEAAEEKIKEAMSAGVNGYICKPFTPEILKEKLNAVFS